MCLQARLKIRKMFDVPFYVIVTSIIVLNIIPGPTLLYVAHQTVNHGLRCGLLTAMSVQIGIMIHIIAAMLGLPLFLRESPIVFHGMKYVGAGLLLYLGYSLYRQNQNLTRKEYAQQPLNLKVGLMRGILINTFNPKVLLFFVVLMPKFLNIHSQNSHHQLWLLGIGYLLVSSMANFVVVIGVAATIGNTIKTSPIWTKIGTQMCSLIFIGFGCLMLFK